MSIRESDLDNLQVIQMYHCQYALILAILVDSRKFEILGNRDFISNHK